MKLISLIVTVGCVLLSCISSGYLLGATGDVEFFVAPTGSDDHPGTRAKPFRSISKGLDATRKSTGKRKILSLAGGRYELLAPLVLGKNDCGLTIRADDPENRPRLIGGRLLTGFRVLKDMNVLKKLPRGMQGKVWVVDLKKLGISDYGKSKPLGFGHGGTSEMELFVNGTRGTLARYPNHGWLTIDALPQGKGGQMIKVSLEAGRLQRWKEEKAPWLYGYWYHGWADQFVAVSSVDVGKKNMRLEKLGSYGLRKGQRFFGRNLLSELDMPGEYYIDRLSGKLYLHPDVAGDFEALVSTFESPILQVVNADRVALVGLSVEVGRGSGIQVKQSDDVTITNCRVSNVGDVGVIIDGGKNCKVDACKIFATGAGGLSIRGGDRPSLTPAGHLAARNHIHHISQLRRTYTPAISLGGVGNRAVNNLLHHAPHQAISFNGNDHIIAQNEIHHVVLETDDSGAIYTCPRDFTSRGTQIRQNYIHHSGPHFAPKVPAALRTEKHVSYEPMHIHGTSLIYLDDLTGGMTVEGNVLEGAYRAMLIGGGRDNLISGNLILGGNIGIWIDGRGLGWAAKHVAKGGDHGYFRKFAQMNGDQPPYVTHYPALRSVLTNHPAAPVDTVAQGNVILGAKQWKKTDGKSDPYIRWVNNYHVSPKNLPKHQAKSTPGQWLKMVDPAELKKINFKPIPFLKIGWGG